MGTIVHRARRRAFAVVLGAATLATTALVATAAPPAGAATTWVVTLGDSAISGEAGRWAGNTNQSSSKTDTGANAYHDNAAGTGEAIVGCHRSRAAEAHIGGGIGSLNLACSGARTYTQTGSNFKPGLDWYNGPAGKSQVVSLQEFAAANTVKAVAVLIGANNYGFADIVQQCAVNWATSPSWWKNYCYDDSSISSRFTAAAQNARTNEVAGALANVRQAMTNAGYADNSYTIIVQTYWSPIPRGNQIRYSESGWSRLEIGGCEVWNRDADWANDTVVPALNNSLKNAAVRAGLTNYVILDMAQLLNGHRLCENTVGLLEEKGVAAWTSPGAADKSEWVAQIRTVTTIFGPYQIQESMHANYWGQMAMRNCLRTAFNGGAVRGGVCRSAGGVNALGEPNVSLM